MHVARNSRVSQNRGHFHLSVKVTRQTTEAGKHLLQALEVGQALNSTKVGKVGWFAGKYYTDDQGRTTPVAAIAAQNELGNPKLGIPPRPTIRPTIMKRREHWKETARKAALQILKGKSSDPNLILESVGLVAEADIRTAYNEIEAPALSPRTIDARIQKKKKGRRLFAGVTKPLIESGIAMKTLTNIVEDE